MKTIIYLISFLLGILLLQAQGKGEKIDNFITQYSKYNHLNGVVLVAENNNLIYKKAFGYADRNWKIKNQTKTKFRLASLTKTFTATLILKLNEKKLLVLDSPISYYLTEYPIHSKSGKIPSVRDLLQHESGLPHYNVLNRLNIDFDAYSAYPFTRDSLNTIIAKMDLLFEPGSKNSYSSFGYLLLGIILEKVTGNTFSANLKKLICEPLKLKNTAFYESGRILENCAKGYYYTLKKYEDGTILHGFEEQSFRNQSSTFSTGGIYSNVEDLLTFAESFNSENVLSNETKKQMFNYKGYGLGWKIYNETVWEVEYPVKLITMDGLDDGHATRLSIINDRYTIIILSNSGRIINTSFITRSILQILKGKIPPLLKQNVTKVLAEEIIKKDIIAGKTLYDSLFNKHNNDKKKSSFFFSERAFNLTGLRFMRNLNMTKEAIQILKWNVEMFPSSINVHDSLAEAYMADGQYQKAIDNYLITLKKLKSEEEPDKEWIDFVNNQLAKLKRL